MFLININKFYLYSILYALIITIVLELIGLFIQKQKNVKLYLLTIGINLISNTLMNICLYFIPSNYYNIVLLIFEVIVILIEAIIINILIKNKPKSLKISIVNNLISWFGSYIIFLIL